MADQTPRCRSVAIEVDGDTVHALVRGTGEPTEGDLAVLAEFVRFLRRRPIDPDMAARQDAARERLAARRRAWEAEHG